ncbi:MAG: hypothetical protein UX21_C0049G0004 [Microgenomates group bacterium GW2011_GWC2_45_8]|nr:MAG: hypothetical protein UX21_C0049G0004 [Microgenomates group bacterium GW2011_GWC2_45_8]
MIECLLISLGIENLFLQGSELCNSPLFFVNVNCDFFDVADVSPVFDEILIFLRRVFVISV